jgi:hypothetical protein
MRWIANAVALGVFSMMSHNNYKVVIGVSDLELIAHKQKQALTPPCIAPDIHF